MFLRIVSDEADSWIPENAKIFNNFYTMVILKCTRALQND